ncbi:MAG: HDIG domain-containing metalloprotein [Phormidesmis sp.]
MRVFHQIANGAYQLWSRFFSRLRLSSHYLKRHISQRYSPWINRARQYLWLDGHTDEALPIRHKMTSKNRRTGRSGRSQSTRIRRSTGQDLVSFGLAKRTWLVTLCALVLLTSCFGQRFYNQPGLDVRSIAPQTFYAPETAVFEDKRATENLRNSVRDGSVQVLKIDSDLTAAAARSLETLLQQGRELREEAGSPPFLNLETLSKPTQEFLFQTPESQWQAMWRLAAITNISAEQLDAIAANEANEAFFGDRLPNKPPNGPAADPDRFANNDQPERIRAKPLPAHIEKQIRLMEPAQLASLQELVAYQKLAGSAGLSSLKTRMGNRRRQYRKAADDLAAAARTEGQPLFNATLFELSEDEWLALEENAQKIFLEMTLQGIHPGAPSDLLLRAIEARVPDELTPQVRQLTADLLAATLAPNLILDNERTQQRAEQAVRQIVPVMVAVKKGDLIVRANEPVDESDFALLDHFDLTGRYFNWLGLCGFSLLIAGAMALYLWVDHRHLTQLNQRDHILVLLLCLAVSILAALRVPTIGLPAVGLLVGSFYGSVLGMTVIGLLTLVLPIGTPVSAIPLMAGAAAAILGAWIAPRLRSREEFALLGGFVGLSQASIYLVLTLMRSTVTVPLWKAIFGGAAMHGLYGIVWSIVALGVSPYLEHLFDVVTPIRLAELANPNRALLKRLSVEAPGTFQHTMFVANLAEAAARALGRNVELVRAGTLYHDIGKMHDPQGFIENQMGGTNKHDLIDDPWRSASIIKKHVTLGLVMARKYRLPKAVQAFIPEHQGDMKISYFYQQAKEKQAKEPSLVVNESDFRYDGPIPQSPETGITMLADSCEAALRSLKPDASMDEAYLMVNRILRARWRSRQLADSSLSRDDMDVIASVFIQVWQQHNHKRIAYPKNALVG